MLGTSNRTDREAVSTVVVVLRVNGTRVEVEVIGIGSRVRSSRPIVTVTTNIVETTTFTVTVAGGGIKQLLAECIVEQNEQKYRPKFHSR